MQGILPEAVRTRPKAGFFNEPVYRGLSSHLNELKQLVRETSCDEFEFVDRGTLIACLDQTALGIGVGRAGLDRLNLTLAILKWMQMREAMELPRPEAPDRVFELGSAIGDGVDSKS
jgi:hypothetical protein